MRILHFLSSVILLAALLHGQSTPSRNGPTETPQVVHFDVNVTDPSVSPCTDFYKYACGKWLGAHPIPPNEVAWGPGGPLSLWNQTVLFEILHRLSSDTAGRSPDDQKIGDYFYSCMDEKTIEANAKRWLRPELELIGHIKTTSDIAAVIAHLHRTIPQAWNQNDNQTNAALFGFTGQADYDNSSVNAAQFDQGGMSLPGRSYYLDQDDKSKEIRAKYLAHVQRMFVLAGEKGKQAQLDASAVLAIETELAQAAMDPITRRDPKNLNNRMTLDRVKQLTSPFDLDRYLKAVNAPAAEQYIVTSPNFFRNVGLMLRQHPLDHWKAYLRWRMLTGNAALLSHDFVNEHFDFFSHTLVGVKEIQPRWRRCVSSVDANLGEALGRAYVGKVFPPENKARVLKMVQDLESGLANDIDRIDWMSAETKKHAHEKLEATLNKIGYPDRWRDYSSVQIGRDNYLMNRQRAVRAEFQRWVAKIGQPVDRKEWGMTPPTINAYEDPFSNTINFPAGILQPPYFEMAKDDAVNYGDIGAIIGHEIIHGFDDQGRKYDAQGNLRDWWTAQDAKEYEDRGKCISDHYTQEVPEAGPGVKQDGRMTLGEDSADNGGLHIAFDAFKAGLARQGKDMDVIEDDGLTPRQRFFLSYAFGWCEDYRPELLRQLVLTDPHSYSKYRVNNTLSDVSEFSVAFGCHKSEQPMARANACRIW